MTLTGCTGKGYAHQKAELIKNIDDLGAEPNTVANILELLSRKHAVGRQLTAALNKIVREDGEYDDEEGESTDDDEYPNKKKKPNQSQGTGYLVLVRRVTGEQIRIPVDLAKLVKKMEKHEKHEAKQMEEKERQSLERDMDNEDVFDDERNRELAKRYGKEVVNTEEYEVGREGGEVERQILGRGNATTPHPNSQIFHQTYHLYATVLRPALRLISNWLFGKCHTLRLTRARPLSVQPACLLSSWSLGMIVEVPPVCQYGTCDGIASGHLFCHSRSTFTFIRPITSFAI